MDSKTFTLACFLFIPAGIFANVSEPDVFEWWDSGVITPEEANEIIEQLDNGNIEEACLLAEVYAQEPCKQKEVTFQKSEKKKYSLKPTGFLRTKAKLDSSGSISSHQEELQISFYRYNLQLGSRELLSYKNSGNEAHFGQISTKELHSHFPLDTLWGTAIQYAFRNVTLAGTLDTSITSQFRASVTPIPNLTIDGIYWHGKKQNSIHSGALQTKSKFGTLSGWWQHGQRLPLIKIQLHNKDEQTPASIGWKTTGYIHGDSVPEFVHLSQTILKSSLWGAQTITARLSKKTGTIISGTARFQNRLHTDSMSVRTKIEFQSGKDILRYKANATCLEMQTSCNQADFQTSLDSHIGEFFSMGNSLQFRYDRNDGLMKPRIEAYIRHQVAPRNYIKFTLISPGKTSKDKIQFQNEAHFFSKNLEISLAMTFKKKENSDVQPSHGTFSAKMSF